MKCPQCGFRSVTRTEQQNKMLWAGIYTPAVVQIMEATGQSLSRAALHEHMKDLHAPRVESTVLGVTKTYPKSTTQMTKQEFSEFCTDVEAWLTDQGVLL